MKLSSQHTVFHLRNSRPNTNGAITILLLFIVFALILVGGVFHTASKEGPFVFDSLKTPPAPITLTFVGDVMADRGVARSIEKNFGGDYNALFTNTPYLAEADIAFANLEGTVTDEFRPRTGSKFSFRMNPRIISALVDAGVDIVSFANNHAGDYSTKGFLATLANLESAGLRFTGAGRTKADVTTPTIIDVRGTRVGFLAATDVGPGWLKATDTAPGILLASDPLFSQIVVLAKEQVDVLVVSFHFGNEYSPAIARQELLARTAVDAGADIVVGHHPHVMERIEVYKEKPIFYSLGNFIFDQYFSPHTMRGMIVDVVIDPTTKAITYTPWVSPLSAKEYIPQQRVPFTEDMLVSKTFTP